MPKPNRRLPRANGMIVAPQPEAANAGAEVLANGGNAMDAILACALVQGVVDPLMCGVGGFGIMHVYDPRTKKQTVYVGLGACPKEASNTMWQDRYVGDTVDGFGYIVRDFVNESGATSVSTPIILDVFRRAHEAFGKWSWNDLFQPAVDVANDGWIIRPHVYTVINQNERKYGRLNYGEKLGITEGGRKLYLDTQGEVKKPGSLVQNPDMARTLALIGREGADVFFKGSLGEHITSEIRKDGGLVSMADLADSVAELADPINVTYRGRRFSSVPAPGGGLYVAQALKVLERFDLASMKHNSPEYIALLAEVMKIATRDKDTSFADPRFTKVPTEHLLSDAYADQCAALIRSGEKVLTKRSGRLDSKHTTHVSCVDRDGLVVSLTHTLGNPSGYVVQDTGMMMNGAMSTFDPRPGSPQSIAPGKRRSSTMCPSIVFEDEKPVLTLGAPGASWIGPAVLQVTLNVLDWGMDIQEAISAARVVATSNMVDISNRISTKSERALNDMGYETRRSHYTYAFAGVHGITMWPEQGLQGGADPQRDGMAVGVF
ncbi:MAG: gamma-glutamyltransferase family protein [Ferrovibrio sp.]|uniref:gamma-glutamyltransferase family protein n=1 Tax=Ferrovibrio sp. TaxID=1917215 RepID=UPI002637CD46|nr:gamma-glutamyltransferase family protein [Ferrovibrio sp.]MCW0236315.1 gamma-glutamyltransferase family protein [Ferrovibrio sp.]